ncbi:MAG: Arc family DNA-binding protein [Pseudomonadota bacterium]
MTTMIIENVPDRLYDGIKKRAEEKGRTVDDEVITCLERALRRERVDPEAFLAEVEALQQRISLPYLTDEILRAAKEEERP